MLRLRLSASLIALSILATGAVAQTNAPDTTPTITDPAQAFLALPRAQPTIPAPEDRAYPGVIRLEVDATDLDRRIVRVRETIPVAPGALTLLYPKYLPGNHADTGPIQLVAGLTVTAGDRRLEWLRDTAEPYAFHLDVPEGVSEIVVEFQWLTQADNSQWRVVMTPAMLNMQWEKALLYPAGHASTRITLEPSIRLPEGWQYGTALETQTYQDGVATFAPVDLYTLVDSPMFAGAHFQRHEIDPGAGNAVHLNIFADKASNLAPTAEQIGYYEALVAQTDRLFGARHYDRYEFLLALTDQMGGIGLEHHRSSENTEAPTFFTDWAKSAGDRALLAHEFTHSWNGKHMRPADELTANYEVPTQNTLLWVYEGQTEYWGDVLAARSGLHNKEEALIALAVRAAFYENQPGRAWRALQDTDNHNLLGYRVPGQWTSWMRGTSDYYNESLLIWLEVDTLIREQTNERKSLDDFARAFFGQNDGVVAPRGYTFEDVVTALNGVMPHDWEGFLRERLDAVGPEARAPLDGITRAGYRLAYVDTLNDLEKRAMSNWGSDFQYSLGFSLSGANNRIGAIRWGGPAYEASIGAGWDLLAVNDVAATPEVLRDAVTAAKGTDTPMTLILRNGSRFRTVSLNYDGGLRYPRLERIEGKRDRLADILRPRASR